MFLMELKMIKAYKGGFNRMKSNGTFSKKTVDRAKTNINKITDDLALDNLFEETLIIRDR